MIQQAPKSTLFPYTTLFRSVMIGGFARRVLIACRVPQRPRRDTVITRSEEHTSELQSHSDLVCRLLLEKKNTVAGPAKRANFGLTLSVYQADLPVDKKTRPT